MSLVIPLGSASILNVGAVVIDQATQVHLSKVVIVFLVYVKVATATDGKTISTGPLVTSKVGSIAPHLF